MTQAIRDALDALSPSARGAVRASWLRIAADPGTNPDDARRAVHLAAQAPQTATPDALDALSEAVARVLAECSVGDATRAALLDAVAAVGEDGISREDA